MFDLPDDWVWDFWTTHDGDHYHLFFLHAPRSLVDPDLRHVNAVVGHATSPDLIGWTAQGEVLRPQDVPAFDDLATWTGSVVRDDRGRWWMFTSGISREHAERVQRIGAATSVDLVTWERTDLLLEADPRWYAVHEGGATEEHWRDPFVIRAPDGDWHMYVTAKAPGTRGNGVVGHAVSADLVQWEVRPPLSRPSGRFDQLEVISLAEVEGRWALVFSCLGPEMPGAVPGDGGVWSVPVPGPGSPVDLDHAVRLTTEDLYVGRVVHDPAGRACLLAFENRDEDGAFRGGVIDPLPVRWNSAGTGLEAGDAPRRWRP